MTQLVSIIFEVTEEVSPNHLAHRIAEAVFKYGALRDDE